jgi:hypothetical protein
MKPIRKYTRAKDIVIPITRGYNHRKYIRFYYPTIHWDTNVVKETIIRSVNFRNISAHRIFRIYKKYREKHADILYYCINENSNIKNHVINNKTIQRYIIN